MNTIDSHLANATYFKSNLFDFQVAIDFKLKGLAHHIVLVLIVTNSSLPRWFDSHRNLTL